MDYVVEGRHFNDLPIAKAFAERLAVEQEREIEVRRTQIHTMFVDAARPPKKENDASS